MHFVGLPAIVKLCTRVQHKIGGRAEFPGTFVVKGYKTMLC